MNKFPLLYLSSSISIGGDYKFSAKESECLDSQTGLDDIDKDSDALLNNASESSSLSSSTEIPCPTTTEVEIDDQRIQNDKKDFPADEDQLPHLINIRTPSTNVKHLFQYIDQKCHSIFPPWTNSLSCS